MAPNSNETDELIKQLLPTIASSHPSITSFPTINWPFTMVPNMIQHSSIIFASYCLILLVFALDNCSWLSTIPTYLSLYLWTIKLLFDHSPPWTPSKELAPWTGPLWTLRFTTSFTFLPFGKWPQGILQDTPGSAHRSAMIMAHRKTHSLW